MDTVRQAIETFVSASLDPAVLEPGEPLIPLLKNHYALEQRGQRLTLQVWNDQRNIVRRILRIDQQTRGRLSLAVEKFARREGTLDLIDRGRPATRELQRKSTRMIFRERLRHFLSREFADWKIAELTSDPDLEHSLTPAFPRALLRRGKTAWAAIGAAPDSDDVSASLAAGIIWLDYLRRRETKITVEGLAIVLPAGAERDVSLRLPYLNPNAARFDIFTYSDEDFAARLDPRDYGNVQTTLDPYIRAPHLSCQVGGVAQIEKPDGTLSLRVNGWEIAKVSDPPDESRMREIESLAQGVAGIRTADPLNPSNPLYRNQPESWLEAMVRANLRTIDPSLRSSPIYEQAPTFTAGNRAIIDLLACDAAGRLAVIEIKAAADIQLPMQALDYWLRVKWHLDRKEFTNAGYFPGIELHPDPPKLLLIAPALEFHPTTETILRYLSPAIEVERIGLNTTWRRELKILFRAQNADTPDSANLQTVKDQI